MKKRFLTLLLILLLPNLCLAASYLVDGITDGDTIKVLNPAGEKISIRFYGVDAPETSKKKKPGQPYGNVAKKRVNELIRKEYVELDTYGSDRYGRTIAVVWSDGININETLIAEGLAHVYDTYCKESFCDSWKYLEGQARMNGTGLFADPNAIPPWEWRKMQKQR